MKKWIIAVVAILAVGLLGYGLIDHLSAITSPLAPEMSEMAPTNQVAPQPLDEEMLARMTPGDIAEMLNDLYRQWLREFEGEGWLYVIASHDRSDDDYGVLSDGTPIPADYDMHSWWSINGDGTIVNVISQMFDTQGTLIQSSYSNGSYTTNFPSNERWETEPHEFRLHSWVLDMIARLEEDQGIEVSAELVTVGGMDAIQVTILEIGPPNIQQIGVVGLETGQPIFTCTELVLSNEGELYSDCMWNLDVRWEEPPPEQIDILESLPAVES